MAVIDTVDERRRELGDFLRASRQFPFSATINDGGGFGAQSLGGAGGVHGDVAATHYHHLFAA